MSSFSNYLEDAALDHIFRNTAMTSPTSVYLALFTASPGEADSGTEVSGGSYSRQEITFGAASGGAMTNTSEVSFTASGGNFGSIVSTGIYDASTGGNLLAWDDITSATVNDGDTISFASGDIDITLT